MSRTVMKIPYEGDKDKIDESIREILINDDYREIDYNHEVVWKKELAWRLQCILSKWNTKQVR